jgi:hypothetical protein
MQVSLLPCLHIQYRQTKDRRRLHRSPRRRYRRTIPRLVDAARLRSLTTFSKILICHPDRVSRTAKPVDLRVEGPAVRRLSPVKSRL